MKKILITGGSGFIGSNIADLLINEGYNVRIFDIQITDNISHLKSNNKVELIIGDILDINSIMKAIEGVDIVLHQAGNAYAGKSIDDPIWDLRLNVEGTFNMLEACRKADIKRFIYASSMYVYGLSVVNPISENHPENPYTPYGCSKLIGEKYSNLFKELYGIPTVILRYFKVYGPRHKGALTAIARNIVINNHVKIYGDGTQSLDFVHVEDVAKANLLAFLGQGCIGKTYNIGSGKEISINQLIDLICNLAKVKKIKREYVPLKQNIEPLHYVANINEAQRNLNYTPMISMEEGISRTLKSLS